MSKKKLIIGIIGLILIGIFGVLAFSDKVNINLLNKINLKGLVSASSEISNENITYTPSSETNCVDGICTSKNYMGLIFYENETGDWNRFNTKIGSSNSLFDYEVTKNLYQAYFKSNPTEGQVVKFVKDNY